MLNPYIPPSFLNGDIPFFLYAKPISPCFHATFRQAVITSGRNRLEDSPWIPSQREDWPLESSRSSLFAEAFHTQESFFREGKPEPLLLFYSPRRHAYIMVSKLNRWVLAPDSSRAFSSVDSLPLFHCPARVLGNKRISIVLHGQNPIALYCLLHVFRILRGPREDAPRSPLSAARIVPCR